MMTRVIITGDRHWNCQQLAFYAVGSMMTRYGVDLVIVHGTAPGVDSAFAEACDDWGATHEPHPADWDKHGRGAGPKRNAEMVAAGATFALAVHRNLMGSKGTKDCVQRCLKAGIPVWLVDSEKAKPRLIRSIAEADTTAAAARPEDRQS